MGRLSELFRLNPVIASNLGVKAISDIASKAIRFLMVVAAARLLGPAGFGLYTFAFAFGSILSVASDFGLHLLLAREVARGETGPARILGRVLRAKIYLSLGAGAILLIGALLYPRPAEVRVLLVLSGAWLLAQSWCEFWNHYFRGRQSLKAEAILNLLNAGLSTLLGIALLLLGYGVRGVLGSLLASALLTNLVAVGMLRRRRELPERQPASASWSIIRSAAPIGLALLLSTLYFRIDMVFLEQMRGEVEVGTYGAAYRLIESLMFLPALFLAALYPALAAVSSSGAGELKRLYRAGMYWMFLLSAAVVLAIWLLASPGLRLLFGTRYEEAIPILRLLAPSLLFIFPNYVVLHLLVATRAQRWNILIAGLGVVVNVGLNFPAVRLYGASGAAVVTLLTEVVMFACGVFAVRRRLAQITEDESRRASVPGAAGDPGRVS